MRESMPLLDQAVEGRRGAGHQPDAGDRRQRRGASRATPGVASSMPIGGAEDDQLHHPRLGQGAVLAQPRRQRDAGRRRGGADGRGDRWRQRTQDAWGGHGSAGSASGRARSAGFSFYEARGRGPPGQAIAASVRRRGRDDQEGEDDDERRRAARCARPPRPAASRAARCPGRSRSARRRCRRGRQPRAGRRHRRSRPGARRGAASAGSRTKAPRRCAMWIAVRAANGRKPPSPSPPSGRRSSKRVGEAHRRPPAALAGRETRCRRGPRSWC